MAGGDNYDVFVSYSRKDELIARALVERLRREGIRYWKAPESVPAGKLYPEVIAEDIPRCRVILVLLSDKSNGSDHVRRELHCALDECKPILPVRIEPVEPSTKLRYALAGAQRLDAFPPFLEHLDRIAESLRAQLETLRRETPVVRVLEPADKFTATQGSPLKVGFEILLGGERRLKRVRLELRRDGRLLLQRQLAESELNDRGGRHHVEWLLPESLADGGHFQLAVLASDNGGQEGSAEMEGSFTIKAAAPAPAAIAEPVAVAAITPVPEPAPVPELAPAPLSATEAKVSPVSESPQVVSTKPAKPTAARLRFGPVVEALWDVARSAGPWCLNFVLMLALSGAVANVAHNIVEPFTATREKFTAPVPTVWQSPFKDDAGSVTGSTLRAGKSHSAAYSILHPDKAPKPPAGTDPPPDSSTPQPPDRMVKPFTVVHSPLVSQLENQAKAPNGGGNGLSRWNPNPLENWRVTEGPRVPGRPLKAIWSTVQSPSRWNDYFHAAVPPPQDEKGIVSAAWQGGLLGAMLGLIAGLVALLMGAASAAIQRVPLSMLDLGNDDVVWLDFGVLAVITALTIFDTGARQPDTGKWTTPLFWWVAGLTVLAFLGSSTLKEAANLRRQRKMLG